MSKKSFIEFVRDSLTSITGSGSIDWEDMDHEQMEKDLKELWQMIDEYNDPKGGSRE